MRMCCQLSHKGDSQGVCQKLGGSKTCGGEGCWMPLEPPEVYPQGFQSPAAAVFTATKPLLLPGSSQLDSLSPCFFYLRALVSSPSGYLFPSTFLSLSSTSPGHCICLHGHQASLTPFTPRQMNERLLYLVPVSGLLAQPSPYSV